MATARRAARRGGRRLAGCNAPVHLNGVLRKFSPAGVQEWLAAKDLDVTDIGTGVAVDPQGNPVWVGQTFGFSHWREKRTAAGAVLWSFVGDGRAESVAVDLVGRASIAGTLEHDPTGGGAPINSFWVTGVAPGGGNVLVVGRSGSDLWFRKLDPAGAELCTVTVPGAAGADIAADAAGNITVVGTQHGATDDVLVQKYTP